MLIPNIKSRGLCLPAPPRLQVSLGALATESQFYWKFDTPRAGSAPGIH